MAIPRWIPGTRTPRTSVRSRICTARNWTAGSPRCSKTWNDRGMLKETLVVAIGEFGRSPRIGVSTSGNSNAPDGRDHWPYCYSGVVAGCGIAEGAQYGESRSDRVVTQGQAGASQRSAGNGLLRARDRSGYGGAESSESAARVGQRQSGRRSLELARDQLLIAAQNGIRIDVRCAVRGPDCRQHCSATRQPCACQ